MHVLVLGNPRDCLVVPWVTDVTGADDQLGEVERNPVQLDGHPTREGISGPVWPNCVQKGTPSSRQAT